MQNVQSLQMLCRANPELCFLKRNLNYFATLSGIPSVLLNGYTYSYVHKESKKGEECCRPIKSKCYVNKKLRNTCKLSRGEVKCGKGCSQIIKALKKLQRKEKKKKEKKKKEKKKKGKKKKDKNSVARALHGQRFPC